MKKGKIKHKGHCIRSAISSRIGPDGRHPMSMSTEELETGLKIAKARLTEFKKTHKELRKSHLKEKLVEAVATGKVKKASDME